MSSLENTLRPCALTDAVDQSGEFLNGKNRVLLQDIPSDDEPPDRCLQLWIGRRPRELLITHVFFCESPGRPPTGGNLRTIRSRRL